MLENARLEQIRGAAIGEAAAAGDEADADAVTAQIEVAALEQFCELGIRRSSMADVARRAGVSRATVFRRFSSKEGLVQAVIEREVRAAVASLDERLAEVGPTEERLVRSFLLVVDVVAGHPLFHRLLRSEPEAVLPLLTVDGQAVLSLYQALTAQRLRVEMARGKTVRVDDVDQAAEVLARLALSFVLIPDPRPKRQQAERLEQMVRTLVVPMLQGARAGC